MLFLEGTMERFRDWDPGCLLQSQVGGLVADLKLGSEVELSKPRLEKLADSLACGKMSKKVNRVFSIGLQGRRTQKIRIF